MEDSKQTILKLALSCVICVSIVAGLVLLAQMIR